MRLRLITGETVLEATLNDGEITRDFVGLLPLTLTFSDLFGREKYGHLPRALAAGGPRQHNFEVGDLAYWPPGPDLAIFYEDGGPSIPNPGIALLGRIDSGVEALKKHIGPVRLTIETVD
jgi:hypothetical protein